MRYWFAKKPTDAINPSFLTVSTVCMEKEGNTPSPGRAFSRKPL